MPVCDGVQTLEMIRSEPEYADIPVIFLTGVSDMDKVKEALKLKPQGYILKNTDRVDFLNKVNQIFGN
jgi:CheY-like chemotaxis protein